jgi:histidine ammonia-lyase
MVDIGSRSLSLQNFSDIVFKEDQITLNPAALEKVNASFQFLKNFSTGKLIYGINTGFGPMAQYKVSDENRLQLQYNLIRSHSSGMGNIMSPLLGKGVLVARLNSLMQAHSGIHTSLVELLAALINKYIIPCIYEHGGVGAS